MAYGKLAYQTANANEIRESVLDVIKDISPNEDVYFTSNLGVADPALQPLHEWNLFNDARPTSLSTPLIEGAETVYGDMTAETRSSNRTVILGEPVKISRTMASVAHVTGGDPFSVEKERALRRLKANMEFHTINGVVAAMGSASGAEMAGIDSCISTNVTARTSGTSFTEIELNDIVQQSWDAVAGAYVMDLLVAPVVIKRRIAGFGTNLTRNVQAADKRLTSEVRVYDSEVGQTVKIIAHKDVRKAAGTLTVLGIREELFEQSFLIDSGEPHWEDRPATGDYKGNVGTYITEFTLVSYNQNAHVKRTGYATTL